MNHLNSFVVVKSVVVKHLHLKKAALAVAFSLTSLSSPLHAQVSGNQANTLFEMQALRQEVAELRDMVERQQYELRKMQRSLQESKPASPVVQTKPINLPVQQVAAPKPQNQVLPSTPPVANQVQRTETIVSGVPSNIIKPTGFRDASGVIDATAIPTEPVLNNPQTQPAPIINSPSVNVGRVQTLGQSSLNRPASEQVRTVNTITTSNDNFGDVLTDIRPVETISAGAITPNTLPIVTQANGTTVSQLNTGETAAARVANSSQGFNVVSENDYYQQAFGLLKDSKHAQAVSVFQLQIKSYPQGNLADDAYYWVAESMYVNRKLDIAKENYKALVQGYPNSDRLPDAMLKLAYIEQEQGNAIESRILFQEIMQFHPNSDAALSAKNKLSEIN